MSNEDIADRNNTLYLRYLLNTRPHAPPHGTLTRYGIHTSAQRHRQGPSAHEQSSTHELARSSELASCDACCDVRRATRDARVVAGTLP